MAENKLPSKEFDVEAFGKLVYPRPRAVPPLPEESEKQADSADAK